MTWRIDGREDEKNDHKNESRTFNHFLRLIHGHSARHGLQPAQNPVEAGSPAGNLELCHPVSLSPPTSTVC
jgi:hypothetical protein